MFQLGARTGLNLDRPDAYDFLLWDDWAGIVFTSAAIALRGSLVKVRSIYTYPFLYPIDWTLRLPVRNDLLPPNPYRRVWRRC